MAKPPQLTVTLTPELEAFIRDRVTSGRYDTPSEVVREGLKLLEVREHEREAVLAELRRERAVGLEEARAGHPERRRRVLRGAGARGSVDDVKKFVLTPTAKADVRGILDFLK